MRRVAIIALCAAFAMPLWGDTASAGPERSNVQSYNAFWYSRRKVDSDTYIRTTWYAGVYAYEGDFWSDLYKSSDRCEKRDGRDRCRQASYLYGDIDDLGNGTFTLDSKLDTGTFSATYPMERYGGPDDEDIGRVTIDVELVGTGDLSRSRETYVTSSKCFHVRFSGTRVYREAVATGELTFHRTGTSLSLSSTDDANMSVGSNFWIEQTCNDG